MAKKRPAIKPIGMKQIKISDLEPNPHNPRFLFDPIPMGTLKESIEKVGILVPLTVYERKKSPGTYVILDGQRRWICAQEVGLAIVPANIVPEPSVFENIVTMFQIHKLREDWELMPTALKVQILMDDMEESNDKKLAELTGMDEAVIVRCKKLLSYPKKYQEMMLRPDPEDRWPADFFIELYAVLSDRVVKKFRWFNRNTFTDAMIKKRTAKGIKAVTEFRTVKQHISNANKFGQVDLLSKRMKEFTNTSELGVDHLEIEGVDVAAQVRKLTKEVNKLSQVISEIETEEFYAEDDFWDRLESLASVIRIKLRELGRRSNR
jgi:ParB family transcriptional regulator, chromosome partitioning protein